MRKGSNEETKRSAGRTRRRESQSLQENGAQMSERRRVWNRERAKRVQLRNQIKKRIHCLSTNLIVAREVQSFQMAPRLQEREAKP